MEARTEVRMDGLMEGSIHTAGHLLPYVDSLHPSFLLSLSLYSSLLPFSPPPAPRPPPWHWADDSNLRREAAAPAPARRAGQRQSESRCSVWSKSISKSNSVSIAAQRALSTYSGEGGMEGGTGRVWKGELEGGRERKRVGGIVSGRMQQIPCCATRPAHVREWVNLY